MTCTAANAGAPVAHAVPVVALPERAVARQVSAIRSDRENGKTPER